MSAALAIGPAEAAQPLLPTPYPSAAPGAAPLNPTAPSSGGGQRLMKDPYPQVMGPASQGNPSTLRGGGQRLIPSTNPRKSGVDRPAR